MKGTIISYNKVTIYTTVLFNKIYFLKMINFNLTTEKIIKENNTVCKAQLNHFKYIY